MRGPKDYLKLGDQNAICDECGFKYKLSELRDRWDGMKVCSKDWEPRHPRDYPRIARVEAPPKPGAPEVSPVYADVTYSQTPTVPTGTFSGSHSAE